MFYYYAKIMLKKGDDNMSLKTFAILTIIGFLVGVWGPHFIGSNPPLVFGWLPLSIVNIIVTGLFASIINYIFFKNYGDKEDVE